MTMGNTITFQSTNGRWGTQIVLPEGVESLSGPIKGRLRSLGKAGGMTCFEILPLPEGAVEYVVVGDDFEVVVGCVVAHQQGLQSNDSVTILVASPGAIWKSYGYKRRSCHVRLLLADGSVTEPPPAVMLAAGLMAPAECSVIDVPPVPALPSALAVAMRKAGLSV